ncbi:DNA starvation/stationary phase protection protein [Leucobacter sp. UCMA 4100]|uniref:Dps family protein n=1 Tax=Leucobacter TaxID=55968 RepID=UPI001C229E29|nr:MULTISPECIES: DNA starvation/stationary phase protection protein [Leucobacter]MDA3147001.1 DNA starvation/stationary phase protection protein [Leucobacter sp. UCMA 4100]
MSTPTEVLPGSIADVGAAAEVTRYLEPVVQDLIALSVNGKQAHWHVRGMNFVRTHEFLDEVVDHAREASDTLAERVVALGHPVDGRLGQVAEKTRTPELTAGFQGAKATIRAIIAQIDATRQDATTAIKALDEIDPVSQDLVIAVAQELDKDRWFLSAHLDDLDD